MQQDKLRDNGHIWDLFDVDNAKDFLRQKEYGEKHPSRLAVFDWLKKNAKKGDSILDIPCGSGIDYPALSKQFKYTGMDKTSVIIEGIKKNYPDVDARIGDIRAIPLKDAEFDWVYARAIFEHLCDIKDVETAMKECYRVAKKGCIFSFFIPLSDKERIVWNDHYFNNVYKKSDIEEIIGELGKFTHEFVSVDDVEFIDSYDTYYLIKWSTRL